MKGQWTEVHLLELFFLLPQGAGLGPREEKYLSLANLKYDWLSQVIIPIVYTVELELFGSFNVFNLLDKRKLRIQEIRAKDQNQEK